MINKRINTSEPFHSQFKIALEGVFEARYAIQKITKSDDFAEFVQSDYGKMICTTLYLEVDGLKELPHPLRPAHYHDD